MKNLLLLLIIVLLACTNESTNSNTSVKEKVAEGKIKFKNESTKFSTIIEDPSCRANRHSFLVVLGFTYTHLFYVQVHTPQDSATKLFQYWSAVKSHLYFTDFKFSQSKIF